MTIGLGARLLAEATRIRFMRRRRISACHCRSDGFSLIELLVVVGIITVLARSALVNYNAFNDTQKTRQAALTIKNNLRFAQSRAYNGEKPTSGCTELLGYRVTFTATSYTMQAQCTEGVAGSQQSVSFDSGLSFSPVPPTILFRVLTRGVDSDVMVKVTGSSRSYQFQVSRSGDMSDVTQAP